jgi:hypothetical protein
VKAWSARNPRITLYVTPTSGSWLNLVEVFFSIITRQAIRRGSYSSWGVTVHADGKTVWVKLAPSTSRLGRGPWA